ncbi:MAG: hypothetical protein PHD06_11685 [Bacteroidales bacterium]|jgi:hypothetical protein|nr:hypothetical protein [Bacteroidales bacterium]MDD4385826.1 hypothetical protein [Bacteroidales bacterium]MDY0197138.1 hypothetical protein [Tenuifilaceae bacterium]
MDFNSVESLKNEGFSGFSRMRKYLSDHTLIPSTRGVYMVLYTPKTPPQFLEKGSGGFFKGKDPNVSIAELENNWVDETIVVYIGKAGKEGSSATLKSRLAQYFQFGQGKDVGHYGGRLIWQLENSNNLLFCWKELPEQDPREVEYGMLKEFIAKYGKLPFANLEM